MGRLKGIIPTLLFPSLNNLREISANGLCILNWAADVEEHEQRWQQTELRVREVSDPELWSSNVISGLFVCPACLESKTTPGVVDVAGVLLLLASRKQHNIGALMDPHVPLRSELVARRQ